MKREAHKKLIHGETLKCSTRYPNYFEDYWSWVSGLSAVNAIGTQMRDPINSGLVRWRMAVDGIYIYICGRRRGKRERSRK